MAIMLPVAAGMTMGKSVERSDSPSAPLDISNSGSIDHSSQARQTPSAPDQTSKQNTGKEADVKREGQDSSEDYESAKTTRTRSKSNPPAGNASDADKSSGQFFAAVFADAVTGSKSQPTARPQADASAQVEAQASAAVVFAAQPLCSERSGTASLTDAVKVGTSVSRPTSSTVAQAILPSATAQSTPFSTSTETLNIPTAAIPTSVQAQQSAADELPTHSSVSIASTTTVLPPVASPLSDADKAKLPVFDTRFGNAKVSHADLLVEPKTSAQTSSAADALLQTQASVAVHSPAEIAANPPEPSDLPLAGISSALTGKPISTSSGIAATGTAASSGAKSAAKAPLFDSFTLQSLNSRPDNNAAAPAHVGKEAATLTQSGSSLVAKSDGSAAGQTRQASEGDNKGDSSSAGQEVASLVAPASQASPSASVAASPDNKAVAQSGIQERIDVAQQLATRISAASSAVSGALSSTAVHKLTVDITPQHWGRMQITLTQSPASAGSPAQSTATIVTESESARQAMLGQVKDLRESLQAGGVKIDKIEIVAAAKPGVSASSDSVVASVGGASAGSLSGSMQQQSQSQQHHSQSGQRFEFGSGAGSSGGQSEGRHYSGSVEADAGANGSYTHSGLSSHRETVGADDAPELQLTGANDAKASVNVLA